MPVEQYSNLAQDTLNGGIDNVVVSLALNDASEFPSSGDFRIRIGDEILICTARTGNTLTVTRGQEGTTATSHSSGATVTQVLTRGGLLALGTNLLVIDDFANRPAAGVANRLFLPNEGFVIQKDDGSAWSSFGPLYRFTPPVSADFSWVNQETGVVTDHGTAFTLHDEGRGNTDDWRLRVKSTPATPWVLTAYVGQLAISKTTLAAGLALRESSTGKLSLYIYSGTILLETNIAGENSPQSSSGTQNLTVVNAAPNWLRITDDGTNLKYWWSMDGEVWFEQHTMGRTTHMAGGPNQFGVCVNSKNSSTPNRPASITVHSWEET
jgi:hypothetical protein